MGSESQCATAALARSGETVVLAPRGLERVAPDHTRATAPTAI